MLLYLLLFNIILPNILAPIFIIVFSLVFAPLFLKIKKLIWRSYGNTYVELTGELFDLKKLVKRLIYLFLLTMGLSATILNMGIIEVEQLLSEDQASYWINEIGIDNPLYISDIFTNIAFVVFPFAVGLWAIGWALEDCGLMHYNLPKEGEKRLFEIEPVHRKYQSMVKGYAGISAIIYFISAIGYYLINHPDQTSEISKIIFTSILLVFSVLPSYILYLVFIKSKFKKMLTKNLKEARMITTSEFISEK